jgi:hypothetical protein
LIPAEHFCAISAQLCPTCRAKFGPTRNPPRSLPRQTAKAPIAIGAARVRLPWNASAGAGCLQPEELLMCRNIKTLFNFEPPATEDEIHASAVQFVRKISGFNTPSKTNVAAFDRAVAEVTAAARTLLASLHTHAPARDRAIEAEKARERSKARFA